MQAVRRTHLPMAATAAVAVGFVAGVGPGPVAAAWATAAPAAATVAPGGVAVGLCSKIAGSKPQVDPNETSVIIAVSRCYLPKKGTTSYTITQTCIQVYNQGKGGWVVAAAPGQPLGTACNNYRHGVYRYAFSKRYLSYDRYRTLVVATKGGVTYHLLSAVATIHTS